MVADDAGEHDQKAMRHSTSPHDEDLQCDAIGRGDRDQSRQRDGRITRPSLHPAVAVEGPAFAKRIDRFPSSSERENIVSKPSKRNRVFVVDDEQVVVLTLATILRSHGFNATSFTQPLEALQAADSDVPDLLISDVMMPLLSGIELAIQIQERCPNCKVLLFSGQASTVSMLDVARTHGRVFDILTKPVHPTDLLRKIQAITESMPPQATSLKQEF